MSNSRTLEWFKHLNDLIGKVSYPIVILVLVFYIIENAQFHALLEKLSGVKVGDTEFTFQVLQDEAESSAQLNSQIQELLRRTDQLEQDLQLLINKPNIISSEEEAQRKRRTDKQQAIAKNSKYSVLVFNRPSQIAVATQIVELLLQRGFSASRTTTDLSELPNPLPPGEVFVTRNANGDQVIRTIIEELRAMNPNMVIQQQDALQPLRRGDVQISLF